MLTRRRRTRAKAWKLRDLATRHRPNASGGAQRAVILLVGLEGMRYEEVADVLGVPSATVLLAPVARPRSACAG
jgi:DNA-directed RNA polymerase specialized sigma24 family protein